MDAGGCRHGCDDHPRAGVARDSVALTQVSMNEDTRKDGSVAMAYGKQFERLRDERGQSRAQLAESSGVELAVIEQIERGDGGSVNLDTLRKLAGALELRLSQLFEDPEP